MLVPQIVGGSDPVWPARQVQCNATGKKIESSTGNLIKKGSSIPATAKESLQLPTGVVVAKPVKV